MQKVRLIKNEPRELTCCAYARVSTFKDEQESSLLMQETYWSEKLKTLPNRKFCGVFADQGISGRKVMQRKEYCKMIELAMAGFIQEIYTKSIYRFGRNSKETMEAIQKLREKGVAIIFDEENINTLTCNQDIILKIKAVLSEYELKTMSKNVQFTTRKNFKMGIVPKTQTFGYDFDENNKMFINEEEAKIVRLIFSLYLKGYGTLAIAKQLTQLQIPTCFGKELWNHSTIKGILQNEKYVGDALLQKEFYVDGKKEKNKGQLEQYYITNDHEPIIDRETFVMVQKRLNQKSEDVKKARSKDMERSALSGKITCGKCGKSFRHKTNRKIINFDNRIWSCATKDRQGKQVCNASDIDRTLLNEIILDAYNEFIDQPYELPSDSELRTKITESEIVRDRLRKLYMEKLISYAQFQQEIEKLQETQKKDLEKLRNFNLLSIYKKPKTKAREFTDDIVVKHIDKIIITGFKIEVIFKNNQSVVKEYKYEHRKYCKNY